jgi:hypothetical protein
MVDIATVPDRLIERVGKTEGENVLNRLFTEIVVDPINLGFHEQTVQELIQ